MHYANGKEAKAGDLVFKPSRANYDPMLIGILISGHSGQATGCSCNGEVLALVQRSASDAGVSAWLPYFGTSQFCVTVSQLLPLEIPSLVPDPPPAPPAS